MAFALSIYRLKKYYKKVVLVTDEIGKDILINKLNFPYDEVNTDLENLDYTSSLWAIGKLKTYEKATKKFVHFDNDVFIWKKIPDFSYKSELIVQNLEYNQLFYKASLEEIESHFDYIPDEIYKVVKSKKNIISFNAGTFGCNDLDFIKEFTHKAYEFIDRNSHCLDKVDAGRFNTVFEQLFCYYLAKEKGVKITYLFKESKPKNTGELESKLYAGQLVNFLQYDKLNYIHPLGTSKKSLLLAYQLEKKLEYEFPKVYQQIMELDHTNSLL